MKCEKCNEDLHVTNSRKCKNGVGSNAIPKSVKSLFDELVYRSWKCEKCQISIKTVEARVDEIVNVAKKAKIELLKQAHDLI